MEFAVEPRRELIVVPDAGATILPQAQALGPDHEDLVVATCDAGREREARQVTHLGPGDAVPRPDVAASHRVDLVGGAAVHGEDARGRRQRAIRCL